ncbi:MAG TPA: hypothetical protein VGB67_16845, partial [Fibrella sp.]
MKPFKRLEEMMEPEGLKPEGAEPEGAEPETHLVSCKEHDDSSGGGDGPVTSKGKSVFSHTLTDNDNVDDVEPDNDDEPEAELATEGPDNARPADRFDSDEYSLNYLKKELDRIQKLIDEASKRCTPVTGDEMNLIQTAQGEEIHPDASARYNFLDNPRDTHRSTNAPPLAEREDLRQRPRHRLYRLKYWFNLSDLETDILLLCFLWELDKECRKVYEKCCEDQRLTVQAILDILAPTLPHPREGRDIFHAKS